MNNIDISEEEQNLITERFRQLKEERTKYVSRWKDVQDYAAITNEINAEFENTTTPNKQKDIFINDSTAFTSINQAGDYLAGILWNLNAVTIEPSKYIKDKAQGTNLSDFYKKITNTFLEQMNSSDAGFSSVLRSTCYDQFSYGTSGIGTFLSKEFVKGQSDCCLSFKPFGVWNCCIDEGADVKIDVIFTVYHWRLNQVIEEFCYDNGEFSQELFANLPEKMKQAYENNKFNDKFKIVFGVLPNNSFIMGKRGKVGAKFKGYWFLDGSDSKIFKVDYFNKIPIAIGRAIRVNNQIYGESPTTLAISTIKMLNYIKGNAIDNMEKTTDPALGMISGALVVGNVINRSAGAVNNFNPHSLANGQNPIFPISPTGDISAIVNFLIPELKKDLINCYKIDQLLDFNNQTQMTATESSYRMSIRGKSINGLLTQEKTEIIEPVCHRAISIILESGLFGITEEEANNLPEDTPEQIAYKKKIFQEKDFIPSVVADAMKDNKLWYSLKFNGELEKLSNSETYEAIGRFMQYLSSVLQIKPELANAIKAYEFLDLIKSVSNLVNDNLVLSKYDYEDKLKEIQENAMQQAQQQGMLQQAIALKNMSAAQKDNALSQQISGGIPYAK